VKSLGLSSSMVTRWKEGYHPAQRTLIKLADYFGVSTDYLLGYTGERMNGGSASEFSAEEERLITTFRSLSEKQRSSFLALLEEYKKMCEDGEVG